MTVTHANPQSDAPGRLEAVRTLLNTWVIDNHTRQPADHLPVRAPATLRQVRDELRRAVETGDAGPVQRLMAELPPRLELRPPPDAGLEFLAADRSAAAEAVAATVEAFATGAWSRLRACRDCRWVFYDHSRSGSRVWCGMYATGPQGRACGSIAKTRRYRAARA